MDLVELLQLTEHKLLEFTGRAVDPIQHVVAPYRICPLGAHIDHQGGPVLGRTINAHSVLAFSGTDRPVMTLASGNYPGSATISLKDPGAVSHDRWDRYARGAVYALARNHQLTRGLVGFVQGTLPGGGLSSSASVGLAYIVALAAVNDLSLGLPERVELDRQLENDYLGLQNGVLDQTTILYGRAACMLSINTRQRSVTVVEDPPAASEFSFVVFYSGFSRELTSTAFNQRVDECRQAASRLARLAGLGDKQQLADIPDSAWRDHGHRLPDPHRQRAQHFFSEVARVERGREAWRDGDMQQFGRLMNESCASSIESYESGSEEIIGLQNIISKTRGVLGSRFSGGGYGGCVLALVEIEAVARVQDEVRELYLSAFPEARDNFESFVAQSEGGLQLI